ncbi:MAG: hypothetical protein HYW23_02645 [Candidatus Aenigmarchaeota archaeon]|nr:hypothetical protein [Candidatus Aenigmarchaeota archaeon]
MNAQEELLDSLAKGIASNDNFVTQTKRTLRAIVNGEYMWDTKYPLEVYLLASAGLIEVASHEGRKAYYFRSTGKGKSLSERLKNEGFYKLL